MIKRVLFFVIACSFVLLSANAQDQPTKPSFIGKGKFLGETPPLRDLPPVTYEEYQAMVARAEEKMNNMELETREYPFAQTALPKGPDQAWQKKMGTKSLTKAPIVNFSGQSIASGWPTDCNGTAGPNHYMQTINTTYAIYSKTGTLLAGPTAMNTLFSGATGSTYNDGDPLVLYDEQAARWLAVEFSISGSNDYMLIAVSKTNDPTGTWYKYSFDVADMPDYEKFGIWQDGYYMADNNSTANRNDIYVFQRSVMLTGGASPSFIGFDNPNRPTTIDGFVCVPPTDNDGAFAPTGAPGTFIAFNDDAIGGGVDQLWIYELAANWTTPASSTFSRVQQINVTAFNSNFGNNWTNIRQKGTTQELDAIPQVIMNAPQYRNFGTYQTIVCCHTVDVNNNDQAGIRWYELRRGTQTSGNWTVRQQGTYAPDTNSRWMGSIMLNGFGQIGLGYSISSRDLNPGIRYTGQSSSAYNNATGTMDIPEEIIETANTSQTGIERWGDYSLLSVDPSDDKTFWFTTQYGGSRATKIASFKFGNAPAVTTLAASAISSTSATLNGTVNPSGLATTYYFQYGVTTGYGNNTSSLSAGSGSTNVSVNANISGLAAGTPIHFRLVATNSDGPTNGSDMVFIPGGAIVSTTSASSITMNSAIAGGNVTSDGGSTVTARGVCWGTSANPTIAGSHISTSSGTGVFTNSISGLTANTLYHICAYATNANGTFYGDDLTFMTLCAVYTLPFTESFTNTTIPNCWTQIDNSGNDQIWQFGTITGQSPNPALTGNYAFLNSDAYGSGNTQNADLITPTLDLSGYTSANLEFSHYFKAYTGSSGTLSYSINNGSTWTTISTFTTTGANPTAFSQVINAVAGQSQVKFKWNYTGTWGYYWGIDNINITGVCSLPAAAGTISGSAIVNQGASAVAYSMLAIANASSYIWLYSGSGATISGSTNNITISFSSSATSGVLSVKGHNSCGDGASSSLSITVNPATKTLQVKVFIEGLYIGNGLMRESSDFSPVNETFPPKWTTGIADTVTVVLYNSTYANKVAKYSGVFLHTDGALTITGISSSLGNFYYITIFHRNSVPITSATARSFADNVIGYDFTTPIDQAYGAGLAPQKDLGDGFYGMYTGALDQANDPDYLIDVTDLNLLEPIVNFGPFGYLDADLDGSGFVDITDLNLLEPNVNIGPRFWNPLLFVKKKHNSKIQNN
jgi:hypothetical protein